MNKGIWTAAILIIVILLVIIFAGRRANAPELETATSTPEDVVVLSGSGSYEVDSEASVLTWDAKKSLIVDYTDTGTVEIEEGEFTVSNGVVTGGTFTIDMTTINADTTSNTRAPIANLTNHLKSDDFFAVETYPTSTFTVTEVRPSGEDMTYEVTGNLTVKGKTHPLTFPAKIYMKDGNVFVEGVATVDRTKYDVRFGSASFFSNLGDNVIDDEFRVNIKLVAVPAGTSEGAGTTTSAE